MKKDDKQQASSADAQDEMLKSVQFGVIPTGLSDCPRCAKLLLRTCKCAGGGGGGGGGDSEDTQKHNETTNPFSELEKLSKANIQKQPSSTSTKISEIRLVPDTQGKKLTEKEEKAADALLLKMKAVFDNLMSDLEERGVPKHQLRNYYFHIDKPSHSAVVNIPNDDHHDEFIQRLGAIMKLLPIAMQKKLNDEMPHHNRPFAINPLSTRPEPGKGKIKK